MKKFKSFLNEMAKDLGSSYSFLKDPQYRKVLFDHSKDHKIVDSLSDNIKIHTHIDGDNIHYNTNDHAKQETLHRSVISKKSATKELPFDHQEQNEVDRIKDDSLPKNYAADFIYNHFKHSHLPLKSSDTQYTKGRDLWVKLANRALADDYHVYYHDGKQLHKSTKDNIDKHLNSYFGPTTEFESKHMILSKQLLENKND